MVITLDIEENGFQRAIGQDRDIRNWAASHGVRIEGHQTYKNKWDPTFGVTSMVGMYENQKINLAWGDAATKRKVNIFRQQLLYFSQAGASNSRNVKTKTDLVMASWFPMKRIRTNVKMMLAEADSDYTPSYNYYKSRVNTTRFLVMVLTPDELLIKTDDLKRHART